MSVYRVTCALSAIIATWSAPALAQTSGGDPAASGVDGGQASEQQAAAGEPGATDVPPADADAVGGVGEIIVTAQKRSESANTVPISISAATGDQLAARGVSSAADLSKIVPGFSFTQSAFGPPVFTLRGIGFYDTSIGAKPSVSVYIDEVPLPFGVMTRGATLDLARVEVLKGPQGTLFGQNATGGAINYVAAKPTQDLQAGFDFGFSRFDQMSVGGFVSAPLSDTLSARVSARTEQGGAYQRSLSRPGDKLGDRNFTTGRAQLAFEPSDGIRFQAGFHGFIDRSDTQAAQLFLVTPLVPAGLEPVVRDAPRAGRNNRDADWTPGRTRSDDKFYQGYLRGDISLSDDVTVTSLSSYARYDPDFIIDPDGVAADNYSQRTVGKITAFNQELRASATLGDSINLIVGGNYSSERSRQLDFASTPASSAKITFSSIGLGPEFVGYTQISNQDIESYAGFGNVDVTLSDLVTLHGGVRYTRTKIDFRGCSQDPGDNTLGLGTINLVNFVLRPAAGLPGNAVLPPGGCTTLQDDPTQPGFLEPGFVERTLDEDNVSWRAGVDFKPRPGALFYLSVSRGYKSGSFPALAATGAIQYSPATQEALTAYEAGMKLGLLDRKVQLNAAAFHYDYKDKQVQGRIVANPNIFGPLQALVNVPKVKIQGAEVQLDLAPVEGLRATLAGTYIFSRIRGSFITSNSFGTPVDFGGTSLPYTPDWQLSADAQYDWALTEQLGAFVGFNVENRSSTYATLGRDPVFKIKKYTLVDLRAGLNIDDDRYRVALFLRNAFNEYYYTNTTYVLDTTTRFTGRPRTWGVSFSSRM